jgi:hypothetical protein
MQARLLALALAQRLAPGYVCQDLSAGTVSRRSSTVALLPWMGKQVMVLPVRRKQHGASDRRKLHHKLARGPFAIATDCQGVDTVVFSTPQCSGASWVTARNSQL